MFIVSWADPKDFVFASQWGLVPVFLRKHKPTCGFPGWSGPPCNPPHPWDPPMNELVHFNFLVILFACWEIMHAFLLSADIIKIDLSKSLLGMTSVLNNLDPDKAVSGVIWVQTVFRTL